jgi:hypothetical protein
MEDVMLMFPMYGGCFWTGHSDPQGVIRDEVSRQWGLRIGHWVLLLGPGSEDDLSVQEIELSRRHDR